MHLRPTDPALRPPVAGPLAGGPLVSATASPIAVVPAVRPVSPATDAASGPLSDAGRAGIDLAALLGGGADALVMREQPSTVALATVLERARASLVRGDPGDALAALDEAWEGAMRTESGWYLRSAALTLLGLPGEAERVLQQALVPRGGSVALLFLQSLVRSGLGDTAGARESLLAAEARRPAEPALMAWRAVLMARAGDRSGALQQLSEIPASQSQAALLGWARQSIAAANADASRAFDRMGWEVHPDEPQPAAGTLAGSAESETVSSATRTPAASAARSPFVAAVLTPMESELRKIGAQLVNGTPHEVRVAVRTFLQSLATGGTLDQVARPDQVPALRSVLASLLAVVHPRPETPPLGRSFDARTDPNGSWRVMPEAGVGKEEPLGAHREARTAALTALWRGDLRATDLALLRVSSAEGDVVATAIRFLLEGAREQWGDRVPAVPGPASSRETNRPLDALLTPIRVGLSLLQKPSSREEAQQVATSARAPHPSIAGVATTSPFPAQHPPESHNHLRESTQHHAHALASASPTDNTNSPTNMTVSQQNQAAAYGHPMAVPRVGDSEDDRGRAALERGSPSLAESFKGGQRMRALALVCMALAFAAMVYGQGIVAVALAGGASWLALRSSSVSAAARARDQDTPDESSR